MPTKQRREKNINFPCGFIFSLRMRSWLLIKRIKWILIDSKIALKQSRQTIYFRFSENEKFSAEGARAL